MKKNEVSNPRMVEGFDPSSAVQTAENGRKYLPLAEKKRWLHLWAEAHGVMATIASAVAPEKDLIPGIGMIRATAELAIEGEPTRAATGYVAIQNGQTVEYYSALPAMAMARAESRVLTNAGFNVPVPDGEEDEETAPASAVAAPPMQTPAPDAAPAVKAPEAPDLPAPLANPPWGADGKMPVQEESSNSKPETVPKPEPEPEQMTLEEALAYPIEEAELNRERIWTKIQTVLPKNPTVGALGAIPSGTAFKEDGHAILEWLGGRRVRANGRPVGEIIDPKSRLHQAILTVLDADQSGPEEE